MKMNKAMLGVLLTLLGGALPDLHAQGISSLSDLQRIGNDPAFPLNGNYWLTQDIDASATAGWSDIGTDETLNEGFKPIGDIGGWDDTTLSWTNGLPFTGKFDGKGFVIRGLTINRPGQFGIGLFSRIGAGATVTNVALSGVSATGAYPVGSLAGLSYGTVSGCSAAGAVSGTIFVGGLVGRVEQGEIRRSLAAVTVSGDLFSVGGLVGYMEDGNVFDCYATGDVSGDSAVGGLIGTLFGSIERCYAAGVVSGVGSPVGGLVGESDNDVNDSYWDVTTSGQAISDGGTGQTTVQMKKQATFAGWNFTSEWAIVENASYPYLSATALPAPSYVLTLDPQGGAVAPALLAVISGQAYGALPTPTRSGYAFGGWWTMPSGAGSQVMAATLVTSSANHTLYALWTANSTPPPPPPAATDLSLCTEAGDALTTVGAYSGFFYAARTFGSSAPTAVRGTLALTVSSLKGKMTAKTVTQAASTTFSTAAWTTHLQDGTYRAILQSRGGEVLDLYVRQDRIWGILAGGKLGVESLQLEGARNRFGNRSDLAAQTALNGYRGYYTVSLPVAEALSLGAAQNAPEGSGYLTLTVGSKGTVKIAGVLADGTRISQSSTLLLFNGCGPEASVPFFVPLNSRRGWTGGLLWITPERRTVVTDRALSWFVRWENTAAGPVGFSALLDAVGGLYSTTAALAAHYLFTASTNDVSFNYTGGSAEDQTAALPRALSVTVSGTRMTLPRATPPPLINGAYDYSAENSAATTLRFTPSTGLFKGNFNLYYDYLLNARLQHRTVRVPYAGVLTPLRGEDFADEPAGQGSYLAPDNDPLFRAYRLKRSYKVVLDAAP